MSSSSLLASHIYSESSSTGTSSEAPQNIRPLADIYENTEEIELDDDELFLMGIDEPISYGHAVTCQNRKEAMEREIYAVEKNDT